MAKIEIDLDEILGDDSGAETLTDSVRRQVIEKLTAEVSKGVRAQINQEVFRVLSEELQAAVKERMPALVQDLLNAEYLPVDRYGQQAKEVTTFRRSLVTEITSQMQYQKSSYDRDKNSFTRAVDEVISENVRMMKKDFDQRIIEMFQKEAFDYAMKKMAEKLQVAV